MQNECKSEKAKNVSVCVCVCVCVCECELSSFNHLAIYHRLVDLQPLYCARMQEERGMCTVSQSLYIRYSTTGGAHREEEHGCL